MLSDRFFHPLISFPLHPPLFPQHPLLGDCVSLLPEACTPHTPPRSSCCAPAPAGENASLSLSVSPPCCIPPPTSPAHLLTAVLQVTQWSRTVASGVGRIPASEREGALVDSSSWLLFPPPAPSPNLLLSLVLLVILNVMLFYKLWMLEYTTQTLTAWQGLRLQER